MPISKISKIENKYFRRFAYYLVFSFAIYLSCLIILGGKAFLARKIEGGEEKYRDFLSISQEKEIKKAAKEGSPKREKRSQKGIGEVQYGEAPYDPRQP